MSKACPVLDEMRYEVKVLSIHINDLKDSINSSMTHEECKEVNTQIKEVKRLRSSMNYKIKKIESAI